MTRSSTSATKLSGVENVAQPHELREGQLTPIPYYHLDNVEPAGSINSSVHDMAQWVRFQLGDGSYRLVDTWMGPPVRDWSAEMLAAQKKRQASADTAEKKADDAQVRGTHPTLALDKYAAGYTGDLTASGASLSKTGASSGTATRCSAAGRGRTAPPPLEHRHYDTFRTTGARQAFVTFSIGSTGTVDAMTVEGWATSAG